MTFVTSDKNFLVDFGLAGFSAAIAKTITAPIERVNLMLSYPILKPGEKIPIFQPKMYLRCFSTVAVEEGVFSLWRGNLRNILRYFPSQAFSFAFKAKYKKYFKPETKGSSRLRQLERNLLTGGCAGATSLSIVYPLNFARSTFNTEGAIVHKGFRNHITSVLRSDGPFGFYRGFALSLLGAFVYNACFLDCMIPSRASQGLIRSLALL